MHTYSSMNAEADLFEVENSVLHPLNQEMIRCLSLFPASKHKDELLKEQVAHWKGSFGGRRGMVEWVQCRCF